MKNIPKVVWSENEVEVPLEEKNQNEITMTGKLKKEEKLEFNLTPKNLL